MKLNISTTGISLRKPCGYFPILVQKNKRMRPPKENYLKEKRYDNWFSFISLNTILFFATGTALTLANMYTILKRCDTTVCDCLTGRHYLFNEYLTIIYLCLVRVYSFVIHSLTIISLLYVMLFFDIKPTCFI